MWDVWTRAELRANGMTSRAITVAVRMRTLIRARRENYLSADAPAELVQAVRVGGRLGCLSLLKALGVFVFDASALHVHMERGDSRMRSPHAADTPVPQRARNGLVLHWHRFVVPPLRGAVDVVDAAMQAIRCQQPKHAIATLDSVLHKALLGPDDLDFVFAALPRRFRVLRRLLDPRAESGPESLVRLLLLRLGCAVDLQVPIVGVGFVDLVVDGWLVIECDSKAHHSSWEQQRKDYRRDLELARQGYCVLRLTAEDILYREQDVFAALTGLLRRGPVR
jgi:very-short-patch-repair endonuclease